MANLSGKRALVTGAGTGIGYAVALQLAQEGAQVVFHCNTNTEGAREGVRRTLLRGGQASLLQADLSAEECCADLVEKACARMGGLDILVNNSGISKSACFADFSSEDLQLLYSVNFRAAFLCSQAAARHMRAGGVILHISSVHGYGGVAGSSVYAAMKGAINALTRQMAIELAPAGIRVNAVAPGHIEVQRHLSYARYSSEESAKKVPLGRVGTPEDIAALVCFLAGDGASFITGQIIYSDGGLTAGLNLTTREK